MEQQRFVRKNTALFDAQRRQEKKRTRRTVFYVFLFLLISAIFLTVCVAVFLKVEAVNINGIEKYAYEEIAAQVPIEIGSNIYSFKSDEIEQNILNSLPYIYSVEIKRDLPTTVEVNIVEEKPYYYSQIAGDTYLISKELKVLERIVGKKTDITGLTQLKLNNVRRCIVGSTIEFVDKRTYDALIELYTAFENSYIDEKVVGVDVRSRFDIYIDYDNRFEVYLGDIDNIDIKIRFLVGIIDELGDGTKGKIDVSNHREASVALS